MLLILSGCTLPEILTGGEENALSAGLTALENLEFRDALASFSLAASQGEDSVALYRGKGVAEYHLADLEAAEKDFAMALERCNGIPDATTYDIAYYYAQTLTDLERYEEAAAVYDSILDLKSGEDQARYLRGLCYLSMGMHDKASEDFKSVVDAVPRDYDRIFSIYDAPFVRAVRQKHLAAKKTLLLRCAQFRMFIPVCQEKRQYRRKSFLFPSPVVNYA